jgi:hypothetical protein
MVTGNAEYPTLVLTSTLRKYRKTFTDNVFKEYPLLDWLKRKDNIREVDGGESIVEQLMYGKNSTFASYSGYDTLNITAQEGFTAAVYPWKQVAVSVALNGLERAQNAGSSKLFDITKAKVKQAEMSMADGLNSMLYLDGTGNGGKNLLGLAALVGNNTIGPATVGGIDCTDPGNTWWRSVLVDAAADGSTVRDDDEWANVFYTCSNGPGGSPDFVVTTQTLFEHYEASLVSQLRFTSNEKADGRFQTLEFKNQRLYYDLACPSGVTLFLNSNVMALAVHKDVYMKTTDFKESPDKDAVWSQILTYGNLTTSNRSKLGRVYGQTIS